MTEEVQQDSIEEYTKIDDREERLANLERQVQKLERSIEHLFKYKQNVPGANWVERPE